MGKNTQSVVGIVKIIAFVFLLPVVIGVLQAFFEELSNLNEPQFRAFVYGIIVLVILHLFIVTPKTIYQSGQKAFSEVFGLFPRFGSIVPLIVPLLSILILIVMYLCTNIFKVTGFERQFLFFAGFFLSFHVVLTAEDMYSDDSAFLKPNYFFGISMVVIFNLLVMAALLNINFDRFSFISFFNACSENTIENFVSFPQNILSFIK